MEKALVIKNKKSENGLDDKMKEYKYEDVQKEKIPDTRILTIDEYLEHVGPIGQFQIAVMVICSSLFFNPAYQSLLMVFVAHSPPWKCLNNQEQFNQTNANQTRCKNVYYEGQEDFNTRCIMNSTAWTYNLPVTHSIVSEFNLVCSRESLAYLANSALFIGQTIGGFVNGWIGDRYGRKTPLLFCSTFVSIFAFAASFSPNIYVLIVFRIIIGFCVSGIIVSVIVVSVELVGSKYRVVAGLIIWNSWTIALCLMSLQSYYIPDWRTLSQILSLPYIVIILPVIFIPESVRWYHSQNRAEDALIVLKKVAKWNRKPFPQQTTLEPYHKSQHENGEKSASYLDLLSWRYLRKTLILSFMWFTNDIIYYGVALSFSDIGGSRHRDFVLISFPEILANFATIYLVEKLGRKKSALLGYVVAVAGLVVFGTLHLFDYRHLAANIIVGMTTKSFGLLSYCATQMWSIESFPTNIRSQAYGLFFVMSQCGAAVAPWIAKGLLRFHFTAPSFALGAFPICAFFLAMGLKETKDQAIDYAMDNENMTPLDIIGNDHSGEETKF